MMCELVDEVLITRALIGRMDSVGLNRGMIRVVDRYKFLLGYLVNRGVFVELNPEIAKEIEGLLEG